MKMEETTAETIDEEGWMHSGDIAKIDDDHDNDLPKPSGFISITGRIKESRRLKDLRKQDFEPSLLDFGPVRFILARHFGFCYGVENAIEISYRALEESGDRKVYLLSQMIHNQEVNSDLLDRGIQFIMDTDGSQFIPWERIDKNDIVIIPAFGTTREIEKLLLDKGVQVQQYNTTCPFVEKVWNRAEKLGKESYTIIIHGKPNHEETRATFSHSKAGGPSVIVKDMDDAIALANAEGAPLGSSMVQHLSGRRLILKANGASRIVMETSSPARPFPRWSPRLRPAL